MFDEELEEVEARVRLVAAAGADAVIVQARQTAACGCPSAKRCWMRLPWP